MSITVEELNKRLATLGGQASASGLSGSVRKALIAAALDGEARAKLNATTGGSSGLHVRSGRLRGSIAGRIRKGPNGPEIVWSAGGRSGASDVVYARIHEFGGTITPKRAGALRVPTGGGSTRAGVSRGDGSGSSRLAGAVVIPKRPYLKPAADAVAATFPNRLIVAMDDAFARVSKGS